MKEVIRAFAGGEVEVELHVLEDGFSRTAKISSLGAGRAAPTLRPEPECAPLLRNKPQLAPPVYSLECGEPSFREPEKGEWVVGLYREDDGTPVPLLLWADPKVDLFWDVSLREHVMPPRLYLKLDKQPQIDAATGYPVIQGAVCP